MELVQDISMLIGQRNMEMENYRCNYGKQRQSIDARRIHANGSKKYGSGELQMELWKTTWSTFEEEFTYNMK